MFKYLFIILNSLALFLFSALRDDLDIITGFPNKVRAGETFNAEVTIFKGGLRKFGKLELIFPAGFTVECTDPKAADFNFMSNKATFLWSYLPAEEEFTVSFKVTTNNTVSGKRIVKSNFYYVENNLKEVLEIDPIEIKVTNEAVPEKDEQLPMAKTKQVIPVSDSSQKNPTDSINIKTIADNSNANSTPSNTVASPTESNENGISAIRNIVLGSSNTEFKITHLIKKGDLIGFGKIEDIIPEGYAAASDKSAGASYTFNSNKVRFVWVNLPSDNNLEVSYFIRKTGTTNNNRITGTFDYLKNNETQSVNIMESLIPIVEDANANLAANTVEPIVKKEKAKPTEGALTGYRPNAKKLPPKPKATSTLNTQKIEQVVSTDKQDTSMDSRTIANVVTEPKAIDTSLLESEKSNSTTNKTTAVKFSVQVAALQKQKEALKMQRFLAISNRLQIEYHEGYSKYITEKFDEYTKAKSLRDQIRDNGKRRAFVTAYNTGKRITVQEALMIANQQWYK